MTKVGGMRLGLLALLWGSSFLWVELALRGFSPVQIAFARLALAAAVLLPVAYAAGYRVPAGWATWAHLATAALFGNAAPYLLFAVGQQTVASNVAGMLNATTPLWTILLAHTTRNEPQLGTRRAVGVLLGLAGVLLIFSPWQSAAQIATTGGLACLAAAASYAIAYVYMGRYLAPRGIPVLMLSASQLLAATAWLALLIPLAGMNTIAWRPEAITGVLVVGIAGTAAAYLLLYRLIGDEGATATSTVMYLLPVVAIALGWLVLSEPITADMAAGIALVLVGVALAQRRRGKLP